MSDCRGTRAVPNQRSGRECLEVQRAQIEKSRRLGIRGKKDLEPAIDGESIDRITGNAAANAVRRFENFHAHAAHHQRSCGAEAGDSCANDDDVTFSGHRE